MPTQAAAPVNGSLTGVWAETTVPAGAYILYNGDKGLGFYKVENTNTVAANHAYLTAPASAAKMLTVNFGAATKISAISAEGSADAPVYNLQGVRMGKNLPKGVYIQNGKKFVVK